MTPLDPRHGTNRGYKAHRVAGQVACDPCKRAAATYQATRNYERLRGLPPRRLPSRGAIRRIRALYAIGWTSVHIAEAGGFPSNKCVARLQPHRSMSRQTIMRVRRAYKALSGMPGPSTMNRERALREGWAPPLAWDDIDRDERPKGMRLTLRGCGTRYGYTRHWHAGEPACQPCKDSHAAHSRRSRELRAA